MRGITRVRVALVLSAFVGLVAWTAVQAEDRSAKPAKTDTPAAAKPVAPKPLSDQIKKGLAYLANQQNEDGGWSQGGGWRIGAQGGARVEGKQVSDPSDVGNTAITVLAFLRAGSTPTDGPYAKHIVKGIEF